MSLCMYVSSLGHCRRDDMESAEGMLALMEQNGRSSKEASYTALICGHADKGDIGGIEKVRHFAHKVMCITIVR